MIRRYSELIEIPTFEGRFQYLALKGTVGEMTFGFERHLNQSFYRSAQWRQTRDQVIARDWGNDLAWEEFPIPGRPIVHHMNPMMIQDLIEGNEDILNAEYLISTSHRTHNAIHYGDESLIPKDYVPRRAGDTTLWSSRRSAS